MFVLLLFSYIRVCAVVWNAARDRQTDGQTQTQTDTRTRVANVHFASSITHAKYNQHQHRHNKHFCQHRACKLYAISMVPHFQQLPVLTTAGQTAYIVIKSYLWRKAIIHLRQNNVQRKTAEVGQLCQEHR